MRRIFRGFVEPFFPTTPAPNEQQLAADVTIAQHGRKSEVRDTSTWGEWWTKRLDQARCIAIAAIYLAKARRKD